MAATENGHLVDIAEPIFGVLAVSLRRGASIRGERRRASVHHGRAATAARAAC